jgi:uncharacterized membrane protein
MHAGWRIPAELIYAAYSAACHQLPERSWFLFGSTFSPTMAQLENAGAGTGFWELRQFIGNPALGWKVAWSDRMVSFYGGWFVFALVYGLVRRLIPGWRGLSWRAVGLLLLPMVLDGVTHMLSDPWVTGWGFRETNAWLVALTGNSLPANFYTGDAWGSFNSLARLVTGYLAAAGLILGLFPRLDRCLAGSQPRQPDLG